MVALEGFTPFRGLGMAGLGLAFIALSLVLRGCVHDLKEQGAADIRSELAEQNTIVRRDNEQRVESALSLSEQVREAVKRENEPLYETLGRLERMVSENGSHIEELQACEPGAPVDWGAAE